ncbi:MAG: BolA family transcriptional regulator [Rhizobiales bacterium]|nr:BolA family transcriptional regulator [Hyphomicrobiales bacterium]
MAELRPDKLEVIDESHLHEGHAGSHPSGESHFRVRIVASQFAGQGRVARHRMINSALAEDLATRVHALAIEAYAPDEGGGSSKPA